MDENINAWPKFQWSKFLNGKDEQVVVRGDNYDQFILDVEAVRTNFKSPQTTVEPVEESFTREEVKPNENDEPYWVNEVKKDSPNKGRHFKVGKKSKAFLGWTDEPVTIRR